MIEATEGLSDGLDIGFDVAGFRFDAWYLGVNGGLDIGGAGKVYEGNRQRSDHE